MFEVTRDRLASHPREGAVLKAASCHLKMESSGGLGSSDPWNRLYVLNFLFFFSEIKWKFKRAARRSHTHWIRPAHNQLLAKDSPSNQRQQKINENNLV